MTKEVEKKESKVNKIKANAIPKVSEGYLENVHKPLFTLSHEQLREILDCNWYPKACQALNPQREIWNYSYLAYKGIMMYDEINRKRRANKLGMYVNVPRTFMTIEGIRRNFNIDKLRVHMKRVPGIEDNKRNAISNFVNYDLMRGGAFKQVKNSGFNKLLFGDGFLMPYLCNRQGIYGNVTGDKIDEKTAVLENKLDEKPTTKYYGIVSKSVSPFKVMPDPDGETTDYNDISNSPCQYHCIRTVKPIARFVRDWEGIVPQPILEKVVPGGFDMTNYEAVRQTVDLLFSGDALRYKGTSEEYISKHKITKEFNGDEYVEERIWLGEDFFIMQAGSNMEFCIISPNLNPRKNLNLVKLSDISIPGEYWSMGEPYILRYQHIEENRLHNAILDSVMYSISGMLGINVQYLEDKHDIEQYPGKVWKFKTLPNVKMDEVMQNFTATGNGIEGARKFLEDVKKTGQSTTSITDYVTGASSIIGNSSATETNKLSGASDLAIIDKIKEIANEGLTELAKIYISLYPVLYDNEQMEGIFDDNKIYFKGKNLADIGEDELKEIYKTYDPEECIFADDLDISEPTFVTMGEVSLDRAKTLSQWSSAIDWAQKINEVAYATGDRNRLDIVKMGMEAMENFDVVSDPKEFLMNDQAIKTDEIQLNADLNRKNQEQAGGAPKKAKVTQPQTDSQKTRQNGQPTNRNKNRDSNKNK